MPAGSTSPSRVAEPWSSRRISAAARCWLATNRHGKTFVVEAMVTNPDAALSADSITDLVALAQNAFDLLD